MTTLSSVSRWGLWFVTYGTYADVAVHGEVKPRLIKADLSWRSANQMLSEAADRLGYCIKPWPDFR